MIIVKLYGGLGNQLFQWAFGKAISHSLKTDIKFDISSYEADDLRNFELKNILRSIPIAGDLEIKDARKEKNPLSVFQRKLKSATRPYYKRDIVCEQTYLFDKELLEKGNKNGYYEGYWQNAKYFEFIRLQLLAAIKFPNSNNPVFLQLKEHFLKSEVCSIHIRRGDYAQHPELLKIHGLCTAEYYEQAISLICQKHPDCEFYVFSDDIEWCQKNIKSEIQLNFVSNTKTMYEDLELLSLAKNNITANSSFSWWGAWLNQNDNKTIISPKEWFNQSTIDYSEIVPSKWIKL